MSNMRRLRRGVVSEAKKPEPSERLFAVAIKRGDRIWDGGRSQGHWALRMQLDPNCADATRTVPGDIDGFIVAPGGRFVDRDEAQEIAIAAGQIRGRLGRELLSSDINW